ncbi:MAG: DUF4111 domain-containing protein [Chloroflexi bacterium]|nr:DUF4111 domain-containing protein [Chloroflexota bacterium]
MIQAGSSPTGLQSLPPGERSLVQALLSQLSAGLKRILREQIVGIYLYGSIVTGDFDIEISDIDLVVVLRQELDEERFTALQRFHAAVVGENPAWEDRLELAYISAAGLRTFQERSSTIGIISPGEPFHLVQAGADWLISWYALRESGMALLGPAIETLIDRLPLEAWLQAVREHICAYRQSVATARDKPFLSYIVLTVARGLYTLEHRRAPSKIQAAQWLRTTYPRWAELIKRALLYRKDPEADNVTVKELRPAVEAYLADMLSDEVCGESETRA